MKKIKSPIIDNFWPLDKLEYISACPYCGSNDRTLAYKDVQDWAFYCAPGKWTYWDCKICKSLYLSPRPTEESIGKAYGTYYTHTSKKSLLHKIKNRIKNECFSHWLNIDLKPRLSLPIHFRFILNLGKIFLHLPFELMQLTKIPRGKLLDVGCGSGYLLQFANEIGWDSTGIEIDAVAVKNAKEHGLNIIEGNYNQLEKFNSYYDCILCSHVLEHVHNPLILLDLLVKALKPGGALFISTPNATSHVRLKFAENWRGIEAPRHIAIPTPQILIKNLNNLGCTVIKQFPVFNLTTFESVRIKKRKETSKRIRLFLNTDHKNKINSKYSDHQSDYIQLAVYKE